MRLASDPAHDVTQLHRKGDQRSIKELADRMDECDKDIITLEQQLVKHVTELSSLILGVERGIRKQLMKFEIAMKSQIANLSHGAKAEHRHETPLDLARINERFEEMAARIFSCERRLTQEPAARTSDLISREQNASWVASSAIEGDMRWDPSVGLDSEVSTQVGVPGQDNEFGREVTLVLDPTSYTHEDSPQSLRSSGHSTTPATPALLVLAEEANTVPDPDPAPPDSTIVLNVWEDMSDVKLEERREELDTVLLKPISWRRPNVSQLSAQDRMDKSGSQLDEGSEMPAMTESSSVAQFGNMSCDGSFGRGSRKRDSKNSIGLHVAFMSQRSKTSSCEPTELFGRIRWNLSGEQFKSAEVNRLFNEANTVRLKDTVWHATLFLLYPPLGFGTNFMILNCFLINLLIQISFTYMVVFHVSIRGDDLEVMTDSFALWRLDQDSSAVSNVCNANFSIGSHYRQMESNELFVTYLGSGDFRGLLSPGAFLCLTVSAAWILHVLDVIGEVVDELLSVWHITWKTCEIMEMTMSQNNFTLEKIPRHRSLWFAVAGVLQISIAVALLVSGLNWLSLTNDIVELMLNGVALAYIMEMDELLFRVLAPTKLKTIFRKTEPLFGKWSMAWPVRSLFLTIPFLSIVGVVCAGRLVPHVAVMRDAQGALCRGSA